MPLGQTVRRLRKARGWTQQQYADAISAVTGERITQGTITNVEGGRHENPSERILRLLAAGFGLTVPELRQEAGFDVALTETLDELRSIGVPPAVLAELEAAAPDLTDDQWAIIVAVVMDMADRAPERAPQRTRRAVAPAQPEREPEQPPPGSDRISAAGRRVSRAQG